MSNRVVNGIGWSTASMVSRSLVGFFQIAILTRFLPKEVFGIIAIANLYVNFTSLFLDMGISAGIIHRRNITKKEYSSLFWLNIFTGIVLTVVLYFLTPVITRAYHSDDLTNVVKLLCLTLFINSLGNQQRIVCQKLTYFKRIAIIEIVTSLITFVVVVYTAWKGYGVYSLAYSTLAGALFNNITHLTIGLIHDGRLTFHFNLRETFPFLKIGVYSVGGTILDFFARELDVIIVSATLGLEFLGVYNIAKKLPLFIYGFINPILARVFVPLLAEMNNDVLRMKEKVKMLLNASSMGMSPVYFLMAALSPTIMFFVFGPEYVDGAIVLSVFSILYALNVVGGICSMTQIPLGRTDIGLYWTIFRVATTAVVYYFSSLMGVNVFLIGMLLHAILCAVAIWRMQGYVMLKISFKDYFGSFAFTMGISIGMALVIAVIKFEPSLGYSIVSGIIFVLAYMTLLYVFVRKQCAIMLRTLNLFPGVVKFLEK